MGIRDLNCKLLSKPLCWMSTWDHLRPPVIKIKNGAKTEKVIRRKVPKQAAFRTLLAAFLTLLTAFWSLPSSVPAPTGQGSGPLLEGFRTLLGRKI